MFTYEFKTSPDSQQVIMMVYTLHVDTFRVMMVSTQLFCVRWKEIEGCDVSAICDCSVDDGEDSRDVMSLLRDALNIDADS